MAPNRKPVSILFQVGGKPIGSFESFLPASAVTGLAETVVVREPPLCNRNRVVLQADHSVIVEHGNAGSIVVPGIFRLLTKHHVVLAKPISGGARIDLRRLMPERQLASSRSKVGAGDTTVVMPTRGQAHDDSTSQRVVTKSSGSTAMVVAAR